MVSAGSTVGTHNVAKVRGPGFAVGRATNLGVPQWSDVDYWPLNTTLYAADFRGNNPRWLYHLFQVLDLTGYDSGSVQPMLNRNYISHVPVAVPSRAEQDAIAKVLGALDDKIAANRKSAEVARDLARAVVGRIDCACAVSDLAVAHRKSVSPECIGVDTARHYSLPSFDCGTAELERVDEIKSAKNLITEPVVLVSKLNPRIPRVWPVDVLPDEVAVASPEFVALKPLEISVGGLWASLIQPAFTEDLQSRVAGTTGSHQRVRPEAILEAEVKDVRTLSDEEAGLLARLCRLQNRAVEENELLARTRDELLPLLMDGRISVRQAADTAARVL